MPWVVAGAAIGAAGSIGGGLLSSSAQKSAAEQEQQAQLQALDFQKQVYGNTVANESPYLQTGKSALYSLASLYGLPGQNGAAANPGGAQQAFTNFTNTPAYTFAEQQGNLGANRALAASGLTGSGAQAKTLSQFNQGYASQGFGGYISQLASLAGMGQNAAALEGSQGNTAANGVGQYLSGYGSAGAAGTIGSANSLNGALGQAGSFLNNQNVLNALGGSGSGSGSSYDYSTGGGAQGVLQGSVGYGGVTGT